MGHKTTTDPRPPSYTTTKERHRSPIALYEEQHTHNIMMIKALNALLLATLVVLASAMPSQASRVLLDDAAANATNLNQGSPDCIKADASTGLIEAAAGTADLSTLVAAIKAANLADAFNDTSVKVTVFAPTNEAFTKALTALNLTADDLLASPLLGDILKYHVVGNPYTAEMLVGGIDLPTLEGDSLTAEDGTTVTAANGNATIATSDVYTCQGIVQIIDSVLLPQKAIDALSGSDTTETEEASGDDGRKM